MCNKIKMDYEIILQAKLIHLVYLNFFLLYACMKQIPLAFNQISNISLFYSTVCRHANSQSHFAFQFPPTGDGVDRVRFLLIFVPFCVRSVSGQPHDIYLS